MVRRLAAGLLPLLALVPAACTDARSLEISTTSSSRPPASTVPATSTSTTTTSTTSTTTPSTVPAPPPTDPPTAEPEASSPAAPDDVEGIIRAEFGPIAGQALRVARCESRYRPGATNGPSRGLFQIHEVHADQWLAVIGRSYWSSWDDPVANAAFAHWLHDQAGGWGPWSCKP